MIYLPLQAAPKKGIDASVVEIKLASFHQVALQANCMEAMLLVYMTPRCAWFAKLLFMCLWTNAVINPLYPCFDCRNAVGRGTLLIPA